MTKEQGASLRDRATRQSPSPSVSALRASIASADFEITMLETAWRSLRNLDAAARERAVVYLAQRLLPSDDELAEPTAEPCVTLAPTTAQAIIDTVAAASGVSAQAIASKSRRYDICFARFAAMHLLSSEGFSSSYIGRALGGRDHTTVLHGLERARGLLRASPDFRSLVDTAQAMSTGTAKTPKAVEARRAASAVPQGCALTQSDPHS